MLNSQSGIIVRLGQESCNGKLSGLEQVEPDEKGESSKAIDDKDVWADEALQCSDMGDVL